MRPPFDKPPLPAARRADSQQIIQAVITAAIDLGPNATIAMIAERAGVGAASLHRYFPTTAALFAELSRETFRALHAQIRAVLERDLDLDATIEALCRAAFAGPGLSIEYRRRLNLDIPLAWSRDVAEEAYRVVVDDLVAWLERRLPTPPLDLRERTFVAFSAVRGAVLLSLFYPSLAPPDDRMVHHLARGIESMLVGEPMR